MTLSIDDKRERLYEICDFTDCNECPLRNQEWEHIYGIKNCVRIMVASEAELDRALRIFGDYFKKHDGYNAVSMVDETEEVEEVEVNDPVNRPAHYTQGGIECIDAIEASMSPLEYAGFLKGQVIKYLWRYRHKGRAVEDLKKANFYLDRLIPVIEKEEVKT